LEAEQYVTQCFNSQWVTEEIREEIQVFLEFAGGCWLINCNPTYSGGRDQKDDGSRPAWQIVHKTLSGKYHHKEGLLEWLKV
jgi:hypothetical protein